MAGNSAVQQAGGRAVATAATNPQVQQSAGQAVCSFFCFIPFVTLLI